MEKENNTVVEWNIENFIYWRLELHGECISSPELSLLSGKTFYTELYPRGLSGNDEYLMVKITNLECSGEVAFIGSDGSIICTQQVDYADRTVLSQGPKFMDVYALIKKNEEFHKDQLTLRFQFHRSDEDFEHLITSTIDVQKVSLKFDQEQIENIEPPSKPKLIFRNQDVSLKTFLNGEIVEFMIKPQDLVNQCFLVETFTSMVSSDNPLVKKEEASHVFSEKDKTSWTFSDSLKTELFSLRGSAVILRLVVIQRYMMNNFCYKFCNEKRVSIVPNEKKATRNLVYVSSTEDAASVLARDFMCLFQDQEFSDFQLTCGTDSFPVHRAILSTRSPVFKTMLSCDMKEATSGCIDIVDLDTPTLAPFLTYLYTGAVEDLQVESALKLYYAADKYQVPSLKKVCSDYLCVNVSISNVCDILSLADRHQDQDLAAVSCNFVLNNYNEVLKSKEWESFCKSDSLLALKTVTRFAAEECVVKKTKERPQEHPDVRPDLRVTTLADLLAHLEPKGGSSPYASSKGYAVRSYNHPTPYTY